MGRRPVPPPRRWTMLDAVQQSYLDGRIDVDELERRIAALFKSRTADALAPVMADGSRWKAPSVWGGVQGPILER